MGKAWFLLWACYVAVWAVMVLPIGEGMPMELSAADPDQGLQLLQEKKKSSKEDCLVGEWGEPGPCSAPCGGGLRTYRRLVRKPAGKGGKKCPKLIKASKCNTHMCGKGPKEREG